MKLIFTFLFLISFGSSFGQLIDKENQTKMVIDYWDFNKTQPLSKGKYYKDEFGETTDPHGVWKYYNRYGELAEVRNYYKGRLHGATIMYYGNGKKKIEGFFYLDKMDSTYTEWSETGVKRKEGTYSHGDKIGLWSYYYRDGHLQYTEEYSADEIKVLSFYSADTNHVQTLENGKGEWAEYYTTGALKSFYTYEGGLKTGRFEEYSIYGYPTLIGRFQNGEKDSTWNYFYYTGELEKVCNYKSNKLHGAYENYYDNKQLRVKGNYIQGLKTGEWSWFTNKGTRDMVGSFEEDKQNGKWQYWHPTGELAYIAYYAMDFKDGEWTYFYKDGTTYRKGNYKEDLREGLWQTWYEDGTLLMTGEYKSDLEEGEWKNFWENGQPKNVSTFSDGKLDGDWLSYYPNGTQKLDGSYKKGYKSGEWSSFFENGRLKDLETYKLVKHKTKMDYGLFRGRVTYESVLNGAFESYSAKDYKLTQKGAYSLGKKSGEWISYHPGGKVPAVISNYKDGELNGQMRNYTRRGKLAMSSEYKNGLKHGKFIVYDRKEKPQVVKKFEYGTQVVEGSNTGFSPR